MKINSFSLVVIATAVGISNNNSCSVEAVGVDRSLQVEGGSDGQQQQVHDGNSQHNWWEFGLGDPIADEVALFYLGHTYFQGADIGETLETIYRTDHSDPWSWSNEFTATAERLENTAREFENEGKHLDRRSLYMLMRVFAT